MAKTIQEFWMGYTVQRSCYYLLFKNRTLLILQNFALQINAIVYQRDVLTSYTQQVFVWIIWMVHHGLHIEPEVSKPSSDWLAVHHIRGKNKLMQIRVRKSVTVIWLYHPKSSNNIILFVVQYAKFVKPAFDDFVLPSKKYADVIIPRGGDNHVAVDLIVQHIHTKLGQHDLCKIYPNVYVIQSTFQVGLLSLIWYHKSPFIFFHHGE